MRSRQIFRRTADQTTTCICFAFFKKLQRQVQMQTFKVPNQMDRAFISPNSHRAKKTNERIIPSQKLHIYTSIVVVGHLHSRDFYILMAFGNGPLIQENISCPLG